jgi:hypothetical protein
MTMGYKRLPAVPAQRTGGTIAAAVTPGMAVLPVAPITAVGFFEDQFD